MGPEGSPSRVRRTARCPRRVSCSVPTFQGGAGQPRLVSAARSGKRRDRYVIRKRSRYQGATDRGGSARDTDLQVRALQPVLRSDWGSVTEAVG
jgi:hypothetical protein